MAGRIQITIKDGIIQYTESRKNLISQHIENSKRRKEAGIEHPNEHWLEQAQEEIQSKEPDLYRYTELLHTAILILRQNLYEEYNGEVPLKVFEEEARKIFDHPCDLVVERERDEPNHRQKHWVKEPPYSWKEAAIDTISRKCPEIDNLKRQKDGRSL